MLPCSALCGGLPRCQGESSSQHASTARILLAILLPGHVVFLLVLCLLEARGLPSPLFLGLYLLAGLCQVLATTGSAWLQWPYLLLAMSAH